MLNQLARYSAVVPLVEESSGTTLLEVGSGSEGIARFADQRWEITVCDRDFTDYGAVEVPDDGLRRIEGDVTSLPFADGEFDVVVALDLLEHLPADLRPVALTELARVTRARLIAGCPCGPRALGADRALARYYGLQPRATPPWLVEHLENGFPDGDLLADSLAPFGIVRIVPNERIGAHLAISLLEGTPYVSRLALRLARRLEDGIERPGGSASQWARRWIGALRGGDKEPVYRQIAVLDRCRRAR
ncbi:MAG TPA: class I SAM-dependent methyltransferase [Solirubrobacterales bacterium]|jgi:SAM-dependent methyltransferase|nr:class I SAM-dependent methyltransferase [Solirubrobacterales bacterium]